MKVRTLNPNELPDPSIEFRNYLDACLELCEFSEEAKLGILFYIGATLPEILSNVDPDSPNFSEYLKVISLYSSSTGDFSDYGELNDMVLTSWVYNANLAISKITADDSELDDNLRKIPLGNVILLKSKPMVEFIEKFEYDSFSLNAIQNLNDAVFTGTGLHLKDKGCTYTRAYEAGFAYRMMMLNFDLKGTQYLLSRIKSHLSPLFESLFYSPNLYVFNQHAYKANHLFSQILNNFLGGQNSSLFKIAKPIHLYHQFIFYKENSSELRDEWLFNKKNAEGSAIPIFLNALNIVKTNLKEYAPIIQQSGEVYDESIIDASVSKDDLLESVLSVIDSKYSINGYGEFREEGIAKWNTIWNNKGDYIQFLVILYYETCLHALATKELV